MHPRKLFNWLIALTVAAGLLVAPVSVPAMAAHHAMAAADGMQAMAGDMPCCPDEQDHREGPGSEGPGSEGQGLRILSVRRALHVDDHHAAAGMAPAC